MSVADGMGGVMPSSLPQTVTCAQPQTVESLNYRFQMDAIKTTLRDNLLSLLRDAAGGELPAGENGTTRLAELAGKKGSWGQRMLNDTGTRLSALAEVAHALGLQPWQLLVPKLNPAHLVGRNDDRPHRAALQFARFARPVVEHTLSDHLHLLP